MSTAYLLLFAAAARSLSLSAHICHFLHPLYSSVRHRTYLVYSSSVQVVSSFIICPSGHKSHTCHSWLPFRHDKNYKNVKKCWLFAPHQLIPREGDYRTFLETPWTMTNTGVCRPSVYNINGTFLFRMPCGSWTNEMNTFHLKTWTNLRKSSAKHFLHPPTHYTLCVSRAYNLPPNRHLKADKME